MANNVDIEIAERRGWASYICGGKRTDCPYKEGPERNSWLKGFDLSASQPHAVLL